MLSIDYEIRRLLEIYKELKDFEVYPNYLRTQSFINIFIIKHVIENKSNGVPRIFHSLSFFNYKKFTAYFESIPASEKNKNNQNITCYKEYIFINILFI